MTGKRRAKRQQMRWTKHGAHLLLQTQRGRSTARSGRWYPGLANDNGNGAVHAAAA